MGLYYLSLCPRKFTSDTLISHHPMSRSEPQQTSSECLVLSTQIWIFVVFIIWIAVGLKVRRYNGSRAVTEALTYAVSRQKTSLQGLLGGNGDLVQHRDHLENALHEEQDTTAAMVRSILSIADFFGSSPSEWRDLISRHERGLQDEGASEPLRSLNRMLLKIGTSGPLFAWEQQTDSYGNQSWRTVF